MRKIIYTTIVICMMSGCSLYKTFNTPVVPTENICGEEVTAGDSAHALPAWQEMFTDKALQQLIQKGINSNTDLHIARLNIDQAEALLLSSKLAYLPSFALAPEGTISKVKGAEASYGYHLPLTMQWEIDLFGRLRNTKEQARAAAMQSGEYAQMVKTQLIASIANTYYTLVMLDEQLQITRGFVRNQKENLETIIAMKEAGMQTEAAVNQATANYYNTQASAKDLEAQIRTTENSMALLLNEPPHAIQRGTINGAVPIRINHRDPIPLAALSSRPDVREAEYALRRSFYGVNIARSAFYPAITLGGSGGWTNNLGVIANPGTMLLSAIGSLAQPLFNRGVNRANLKIAKSQYEQSLLAFQKALLTAGNEVNDALIACRNSADKKELRRKQVDANEQAVANSMELMQHSSVTYLEILMAQNSFLQSKLVQVSDWMEGIQGQISLYKALGGGVE